MQSKCENLLFGRAITNRPYVPVAYYCFFLENIYSFHPLLLTRILDTDTYGIAATQFDYGVCRPTLSMT